ncbi:MAG: TetR/AcrR family transcriptional regulator [Devosia sp.]|uniref:TetR/AcrR family transcriptional regulator n=1 Tax=Devosia sp. TaxID=1871048 RepID=UPI001AC7B453|nr:TetR/AcrR family transcriptional regulator [Devosia sp.]MBN9310326.1 TetR/AcrR family transcriptional regulator [Devosia sp.]MBN9317226.1 TetR/AcrR family transcriptional regulator [Devosia sp.]
MDRRVRKTREALYSAFVALIVERGYDAISVQDIIDAADVGRTTFYAHFKSKDELLKFGFGRLRDDLSTVLRGVSGRPWSFVDPLLVHARSHSGLYRALLSGSGGRLAEVEFQSIVEEMVADELGRDHSHRLRAAMLSGALIAGIRSWIEAGAIERASEVADTFRRLVDLGVGRLIVNRATSP